MPVPSQSNILYSLYKEHKLKILTLFFHIVYPFRPRYIFPPSRHENISSNYCRSYTYKCKCLQYLRLYLEH